MKGIRRALAWGTLALAAQSVTFPASVQAKSDLEPVRMGDCAYTALAEIFVNSIPVEGKPFAVYAYGTDVAISKAFEKEGLLYGDIAEWFDAVDPAAFEAKMRARLNAEAKLPKKKRVLTEWLHQWVLDRGMRHVIKDELPDEIVFKAADKVRPDPHKILDFIADRDNPFEVISIQAREDLLYDGYLSFDDIRASPTRTPDGLDIVNDTGSYEVKAARGMADFNEYARLRAIAEKKLGGKVGHQHNVFALPDDPEVRARIAPYLADLMDTGAWHLYFRQAGRNPEELETTILTHPYLGLYTRSARNNLVEAYRSGDPAQFTDKYRFQGARKATGDPELPGQEGKTLFDNEQRSGNKRENNRDFMADAFVARVSTGDYSGLQDVTKLDFDPNAPLSDLLKGHLTPQQIALIRFAAGEKIDDEMIKAGLLQSHAKGAKKGRRYPNSIPYIRHSSYSNAKNQFRNKFVAPLLPFEKRWNIGTKVQLLKKEQKKFAEGLYKVAFDYLTRTSGEPSRIATVRARGKATEELERLIYDFNDAVRLDKDTERVIMPKGPPPPSILVKSEGPVDVNKLDLGIENSFRFQIRPRNRKEADEQIKAAVEKYKELRGGGTIEKLDDGGHGHGLSLRYRYTDPKGQVWRFEWDGINRSYREGKAYWTRGGHIEVPTPKFAPQTMDELTPLYSGMRELNNYPMRSAGGAHINIDISSFKLTEAEAKRYKELRVFSAKQLEEQGLMAEFKALDEKDRAGARRVANFIALFESRREVITAMWQHPFRRRTGIMAEVDDEFLYKLKRFKGNFDDLGKFLFDNGYFNAYISRKPAYMQLNVVGLMADHIPEAFLKTIDIKNPLRRFFPAFGGKASDRIELRLINAAENEYVAGLQIRYIRAFANKAFNAEGALDVRRAYSANQLELWKERPAEFLTDIRAHLVELGESPDLYNPAIRESIIDQRYEPSYKKPLRKYQVRRVRNPEEAGPLELSPDYLNARVADVKRHLGELRSAIKDVRKAVNGPNVGSLIESYDAGLVRMERMLRQRAWLVEAMDKKDRELVVEFVEELRRSRRIISGSIDDLTARQKRTLGAQIKSFESRRRVLDSYVERLRRVVASKAAKA